MQIQMDASLLSRLRSRLLGSLTFSATGCLGLLLALPSSTLAQQVPAEAYGPYNAVFLADGPGLTKPSSGPYGAPPPASAAIASDLLEAHGKWTLAFWFHTEPSKSEEGAMLLAGLGDPAGNDARFIGIKGGRLSLWLGQSGGPMIAADSALSPAEWHCASAVGAGEKVSLYVDGKQVASGASGQGTVAPKLVMAPEPPAGIADRHFGGKIADLKIYREALTSAQVADLAATPPDFNLPEYEQASQHWAVQTRGMAGQLEPQNPSTLPRGKGAIQKPVAKALRPSDLKTELVGTNPWKLSGGWKLAAAPDVKVPGAAISKPGFASQNWMAATVPGTVLTTMIDRGIYPDPDYGLNNLAIPESLAHQDYWYRVEFKGPTASQGQHLTLTFEGVNYAAEVWLNGKKLGGFTGAFLPLSQTSAA